ncbi:MAG: secondary thiamine-phosphate synthase enzyme YjbQ [Candidatus Omnitrophota bacterium]
MEIINSQINLTTKGNTDIIDITDKVVQELTNTKLKNGNVLIFVEGSTAGITTCEFEAGLAKDLKTMFEKLIPQEINYNHNNAWGDGNGHSHLRASLIGCSLAIPFTSSNLCLGTWQQVILIDFDNRPRKRTIQLQFIGKK